MTFRIEPSFSVLRLPKDTWQSGEKMVGGFSRNACFNLNTSFQKLVREAARKAGDGRRRRASRGQPEAATSARPATAEFDAITKMAHWRF